MHLMRRDFTAELVAGIIEPFVIGSARARAGGA
jgi:hypothetical protein